MQYHGPIIVVNTYVHWSSFLFFCTHEMSSSENMTQQNVTLWKIWLDERAEQRPRFHSKLHCAMDNEEIQEMWMSTHEIDRWCSALPRSRMRSRSAFMNSGDAHYRPRCAWFGQVLTQWCSKSQISMWVIKYISIMTLLCLKHMVLIHRCITSVGRISCCLAHN